MSFGDKIGECTRSRTVRILLLILLVALCVVGVFWLLQPTDHDEQAKSLEVIPKIGNSSLIRFTRGDDQTIRVVTKQIDDSLRTYNTTDPNVYRGCNFLNPPPDAKTCGVDLNAFAPCTRQQKFGYSSGSPCVFLKFSKTADFVPRFYNETKLPETMPDLLKDYVTSIIRHDKRNAQMIWVHCGGRTQADDENVGSILYLPRRGFPGFYYPCKSEIGCTEPLVALQFANARSNVLINVQCKIFAENVDETIEFELMIDTKTK